MKTKLRKNLNKAEATFWLIGILALGPIAIAVGMCELVSWLAPTRDKDGIPLNPADQR